MNSNYIQRVVKDTPTRVWINNPTGDDLKRAIAAGAISGTTNPSYCSKLLQREPEFILPIIDEAVRETEDDNAAAELVYRKATSRFMKAFLPGFKRSAGTQGFVTHQGDPNKDDDPQAIVSAALADGGIGRNYMAKIPVIESGMQAMEELIERNIPVCATECFSISQTISACELYERTSKRCGRSPPFYVTHITGIFDDEIADFIARSKVDISPGRAGQAGCIVARREYRIIAQRGFRAVMLGGGARSTRHFTELVGGSLHVTLNWSTIAELIAADGSVVSRIDAETPNDLVEELRDKLPDFRTAYDEDGLELGGFKEYAPLRRFRKSFLDGWEHLRAVIAERRESLHTT
jgi:transaldolase